MLRTYWYIARAATQLSSAPRTTQVLGQELVLFRDDAGHPHALLDRCCHRGAPLSLGVELAEQGRWEAERGTLRQRRIVPVRA